MPLIIRGGISFYPQHLASARPKCYNAIPHFFVQIVYCGLEPFLFFPDLCLTISQIEHTQLFGSKTRREQLRDANRQRADRRVLPHLEPVLPDQFIGFVRDLMLKVRVVVELCLPRYRLQLRRFDVYLNYLALQPLTAKLLCDLVDERRQAGDQVFLRYEIALERHASADGLHFFFFAKAPYRAIVQPVRIPPQCIAALSQELHEALPRLLCQLANREDLRLAKRRARRFAYKEQF